MPTRSTRICEREGARSARRRVGGRSDLYSAFQHLRVLGGYLDAYSRKCVGWKLSKRIDTQLTLGALEAALPRTSQSRLDPSFRSRGSVCESEYVTRLHHVEAEGQYVSGRQSL